MAKLGISFPVWDALSVSFDLFIQNNTCNVFLHAVRKNNTTHATDYTFKILEFMSFECPSKEEKELSNRIGVRVGLVFYPY